MEKPMKILGVISMIVGTVVGVCIIASGLVDSTSPLIYFKDRELHAAIFLLLGGNLFNISENVTLRKKLQEKK